MNDKNNSSKDDFLVKMQKAICKDLPVPLFIEDFSELKMALEDLKAKGVSDFRRYFDENPDFVSMASRMVRIINVNNAALKLFGAKDEEELLSSLDKIFTPESLIVFREELIALAEGKTFFEAEAVNKTLQGIPIDILISIKIPETESEFNMVLVNIYDISRRKMAEEALRESEEKYRTTFDNAPIAINLVSLDGRFLWVNKKFCDMTGYSKDELLNKAFADITHPDDIPINVSSVQQLIKGEANLIRMEKRYIHHKNGSTVWGNLIVSTVKDSSGNLKYLVGTVEDITKQKLMEKEIEKIRNLETIGVLAGGIAHDFNNLLTALSINLFLLKKYIPQDTEGFKRLTDAEIVCKQAAELSNMLLTFASGGEPIKEIISMAEILERTTNYLLSSSKDIACKFQFSDAILPVKADKRQIEELIKSIVTNAIEAMPNGGVVNVRGEDISISERDNLPLQEGKYLKVSIEDNGIGIPDENLSKIFDPYFSTKDKYSQKGMGLGLSIAYSIVKRHNGLITVNSRLGVGTTFHIYLPNIK
jgi:PAS domain S-box-containing protein